MAIYLSIKESISIIRKTINRQNLNKIQLNMIAAKIKCVIKFCCFLLQYFEKVKKYVIKT